MHEIPLMILEKSQKFFKNHKNYQKLQMNALPTEFINTERRRKKANSDQQRSFVERPLKRDEFGLAGEGGKCLW